MASSTHQALLMVGGSVPFSTLNPLDKSANLTLSNGDLTMTASSSSNAGVRSTTSKTSGKLYAEFTCGSPWGSGPGNGGFGIMSAATALNNFGAGNAVGGCLTLAYGAGNIYFNGSGVSSGVAVFGPGLVVCIAVDFGASKMWFRSAGSGWIGVGGPGSDPATGAFPVNIAALFPATPAFLAISNDGSGNIVTLNTGATAFVGAIPSGYSAWG